MKLPRLQLRPDIATEVAKLWSIVALAILAVSFPADIFPIDFQVRWDQYKQPSSVMILVTVYAGDTRVSEAYLPIESLLNVERVAAFRELAQSLGE